MKHGHLVLIFTLIFATGCQEDFDPSSPPSDEGNTETGVVDREIRMKLDRETADAINITRTRSGRVLTGNISFDELCERYKVTEMERVFEDNGCAERTRKAGLDLWYTVRFEGDAKQIAEDFGRTPGVTYVETPLQIKMIDPQPIDAGMSYPAPLAVSPKAMPADYPFNDPMFAEQWPLYNDGTINPSARAGADINVLQAWNRTAGRNEVIVAVVDEGVQYTHPDLAANMWSGIGRNFCRATTDPAKITWGRGHGTHVAGTIAAVNNNGIGISGIAGGTGSGDGVKIMSCQIFHPQSGLEDATSTQTAEAIKYAADNGAVICQNSWGYDAGTMTLHQWTIQDRATREAIDYFIQYAGMSPDGETQTGPMAGGLVIFAAGNEWSGQASYPGSYKPCINVAAITCRYDAAWYTNYGSTIDINAPGGGEWISAPLMSLDKGYNLSTIPTDLKNGQVFQYMNSSGKIENEKIDYVSSTPGYGYMQGTSMACPHVSGVAALIVSQFGAPGFTAEQAKEILLSTTRNVDAFQGNIYDGIGSYAGKIGNLVDAGAAVYYGSETPVRRPVITPAPDQETDFTLEDAETKTLKFTLSDYSDWRLKDKTELIEAKASGDEITLTIDAAKYSAGTYIATIEAVNGDLWESLTFSYTIAKNSPVITPGAGQSDEFSLMVGEIRTLTFTLSNYEEWSLLDPSGHIQSSFADNKVTLTIDASKYQPGNYTAELRASKGQLATPYYISYEITPFEVSFYPNPCVDVLNVQTQVEGEADIRIRNSVGTDMMARTIAFGADTPIKLDVSGLASGTYLVQVTYNGIQITRTIVKR